MEVHAVCSAYTLEGFEKRIELSKGLVASSLDSAPGLFNSLQSSGLTGEGWQHCHLDNGSGLIFQRIDNSSANPKTRQ